MRQAPLTGKPRSEPVSPRHRHRERARCEQGRRVERAARRGPFRNGAVYAAPNRALDRRRPRALCTSAGAGLAREPRLQKQPAARDRARPDRSRSRAAPRDAGSGANRRRDRHQHLGYRRRRRRHRGVRGERAHAGHVPVRAPGDWNGERVRGALPRTHGHSLHGVDGMLVVGERVRVCAAVCSLRVAATRPWSAVRTAFAGSR